MLALNIEYVCSSSRPIAYHCAPRPLNMSPTRGFVGVQTGVVVSLARALVKPSVELAENAVIQGNLERRSPNV